MRVFKNKHFTKRDYECTNIVAIRAERLPNTLRHDDWVEADHSVLKGLQPLSIIYENGMRYQQFGYL